MNSISEERAFNRLKVSKVDIGTPGSGQIHIHVHVRNNELIRVNKYTGLQPSGSEAIAC